MFASATWLAVLLIGAFSIGTTNAIQTISAVGSKFFYENGTQYFLKGITYQLIPEDPLVDTAQCERDVALMAQLGTNAIRVYHVDPNANHDVTNPRWTQPQFNQFKVVLDEFQNHSAENYPIPIFFSETGCNVARPRNFEDQAAIFGPDMSKTWSGSMIYEWIEETNDYGLINYGLTPRGAADNQPLIQDGFARQGVPTPVSPDFDNLKAQWATLVPTGVALADYVNSLSTITPSTCPTPTAGGWAVDPYAPLPTLEKGFHEPFAASFRGANWLRSLNRT